MREKPGAYEELQEQIELRNCVLEGMNMDIYVSDMSSHEILYTNMEPREGEAEDLPTGRICWEALKGRNNRCECCPVTYLLKNPGKTYLKEFRGGGRQVFSCDKIIPWLKGRLAHLHYTLDITE